MSAPGFRVPALGWTASRLALTELPELQRLMERAEDFFLLTEGRPPQPDAAQEEWEALAPGRGRGHKHLWALREADGTLCGCLEATEGYPEPSVCWVGLLLLDPGRRRRGAGRAVLEAFEGWAAARGFAALHLAVVESNTNALRFWASLGFRVLRQVPDRGIGLRTHTLVVLERALA